MITTRSTLLGAATLAVAACTISTASLALEDPDDASADQAVAWQSQVWPSRFYAEGDAFTVYPLQLERWEGDRLEARAAVGVQPAGGERPLFGVVSVSARTDVDPTSGMATVHDIQAGSGSFPTAGERAHDYVEAVRRHLATLTWRVSRERLRESLAIDQAAERSRSEPLRNDPPRIVYVASPTTLVAIDGEPVLRDMDGLGLRRVLNTRALILQDPSANRYFLYVAGHWLQAPALAGPWAEVQIRPARLDEAKQQAEAAGAVDLLEDDDAVSSRPPAAMVSTEPTELVQTDGPPQYAPIGRTDLLFVSNSPNRLFLDLRTQMHYVLLAGRWYRTPSLAGGPWDYVSGTDLPADFASIPDGHPTEGVRAAVPGTPQAQEAAIANGVPEFATVKRSAARLEITYDGPPQFRPIEGTRLEAAVNAPVPVIRVDWQSYYALDNGVWFFSDSPDGPWTAATSVPPVLYTIPRSDPLHYVTYVRVYDATPEEVYVGYRPGYLGSYATIEGTVVYGSGWYYRPWIGSVWYATPATWGFGFSFWYSWWDPWPHRVWWPAWRPAPCFRPTWGAWAHRHVGARHSHLTPHGRAVIPAQVWPLHDQRRAMVGAGGRDRHAFPAHRAGVHDIYRRWDPQFASGVRSRPGPDARLPGSATRDRFASPPSSVRREDRRPGPQVDVPRRVRPVDRSHSPDRAATPRWVRPADGLHSEGGPAAPRSPGLRAQTRAQPGAPPATALPRSPGLRADRPDATESPAPELGRRDRPGSRQGVQPEVQRRVDREAAGRAAQRDPRPSPSMPRVREQERQHSANAPRPGSDARREFRGAPPSQDRSRRDGAWRTPAVTAPGAGVTGPRRQPEFQRDRTWRTPEAAAPGSGIAAPPQREGSMRDANRGSRDGRALCPRQGRPNAR